MMSRRISYKVRKTIAVALSLMLGASHAYAGLIIRGGDGLVMTGADDGIQYEDTNGLVMTGADESLIGVNGITVTRTSGVALRWADGLVMTGADGLVMTGADGLRRAEENGLVMTGADGLVMTGADTVRVVRAAQ